MIQGRKKEGDKGKESIHIYIFIPLRIVCVFMDDVQRTPIITHKGYVKVLTHIYIGGEQREKRV